MLRAIAPPFQAELLVALISWALGAGNKRGIREFCAPTDASTHTMGGTDIIVPFEDDEMSPPEPDCATLKAAMHCASAT